MHYEVVESPAYPGTWHAEAIDEKGRVFVTAFSGPDAERRAREYAEWKNSSVEIPSAGAASHYVRVS